MNRLEMNYEQRTQAELIAELRVLRLRNEQLERILRERVKELTCLYGLSELTNRQDASLDEILTSAVGILPPSSQYPEIACAKLSIDGRAYSTDDCEATRWGLSADIMVRGRKIGTMEMFYREARPELDEGSFLKEERSLLNAVAERLGKIIEHHTAIEELRENEERLKEVQRVGGVGFLDWDLLTNEIVWSEETIRMYGFDPEKAKPTIQMTIDLAHPDDRELIDKKLDAAITGGNKYDIEHRIIRPDGSVIWLHTVAQPSYDEAGRPIRLFGTVIDITRRKQAELELRRHRDHLEELVGERTAALQEAKQRLVKETDAVAAIINTMLHGELVEEETAIRVLDACLAATDSVYGMLGTINEQNKYDVICYNSQTLNDCAFPAAKAWDLSTGMTIRGVWGWPILHGNPLLCNHPLAHPDSVGQPEGHVPVDCFLGVPLMRKGNVAGMVAVANKPGGYTEADKETLSRLSAFMEVSQRHAEALVRAKLTSAELEILVKERTAELKTANRELESFAYSVSHDLRAPLRAIDGFSQALLEEYSGRLGTQAQDYLDRVTAAARRMAQLIDDLLKLSRVTRTGMLRETVDLSAMAREVAAEIRSTHPHRDVSMSIADGLSVRGDPPLLRLALGNLLDNAFKFSSEKPRARIELGKMERDGETVYFVRDDGVGFDMAYAGKLFTPFQRLHSRTEYPGTGVGLATVQRIIRRHGGRVWGEGELDRGATFYFTLLHGERERK